MKIFVTGHRGFVGSALVKELKARGHNPETLPENLDGVKFDGKFDWAEYLHDVDVVIHLAGLAHKRFSIEEHEEYELHATSNLVRQCVKHNVKHFVHLSSTQVYGVSRPNEIIQINSHTSPQSVAAKYKLKLENSIIKESEGQQLKTTIIRCPLIYAKTAKGNIRLLLKFSKLKIPLPIAGLRAKRSYISLNKLIGFLIDLCIHRSDGLSKRNQRIFAQPIEHLTTRDLLTILSEREPHMLYVPKTIVAVLAKTFRKKTLYSSIAEDFIITKVTDPHH